MKKSIKSFTFWFVSTVLFFGPQLMPMMARAEPVKEFVMSCSYGTLAGTIVGAATLAFSDKPGDNLNKVARGASIGLYAGILLGLYVVYGVPSDVEEDEYLLNNVQNDSIQIRNPSKLAIYPLISSDGFDGVMGQYRILSF